LGNASYSWHIVDAADAIGLPLSGVGDIPPFTLTNTTTAPKTAKYAITAWTVGAVSCSANDTLLITVNPTPTVNSVSDVTVCSGGLVQINFTGTGTDYQWNRISGDNIGNSSGNGNISFNPTNTSGAVISAIYEVIPVGNNGCLGQAVNFTITVNPVLQIDALEDVQLCNGSVSQAIHFGGNVASATYSWNHISGNVGLTPTSGTGYLPAFTASNTTTSQVVAKYKVTMSYTNNGATCTALDTLDITVYPTPVVTSPANDVIVCNGNTLSVTFAGTASAIYSWRKLSGDIIPGVPTNGTGNISTGVLTNNGIRPLSALYEVVPSINFNGGSCEGVPHTFTVTLNPTPALSSAVSTDTICSGSAYDYMAASNVQGVAFSWTRAANASINGGVAASGNTASIHEVLTNTSSVPVTVTYQYSLTIDNCTVSGATEAIQVTVLPTINASFDARYDVCANATEAVLTCTGVTNPEYRILFDQNALAAGFVSVTVPTAMPADGIHVPLPASVRSGDYHATVYLGTGVCMATYLVSIHVMPLTQIVEQPQSIQALCPDVSQIMLTVVAQGENLTYQWYFNASPIMGATQAVYQTLYDSTMAGSYYVEVIGSCGSLVSDSVKVGTNNLLILEKWNDVLYVGNSDNLYVDYQWYKNGYPVSIDGSSQYYAERPYLQGTYRVRVYLADGTWFESCDYEVDNSKALSSNIYPNPVEAGTLITVELFEELPEDAQSQVEMYDILGRMLRREQITGNRFTVETPKVAGTYYLRIYNKDAGYINKRFIVK
jgi:hypothetical protein